MKRSAIVALTLHGIWFIIFFGIILVNWNRVHYDPWAGGWKPSNPLEMTARYAGTLIDPVAAAAQLGRLDVITVLLAIIGLVVGAGALVGAWLIRREAIEAAEKEARDEVSRLCPVHVGAVAPTAIAAYFDGPSGKAVLLALLRTNAGIVSATTQDITRAFGGNVEENEAEGIAAAAGGNGNVDP